MIPEKGAFLFDMLHSPWHVLRRAQCQVLVVADDEEDIGLFGGIVAAQSQIEGSLRKRQARFCDCCQ